MVNGMVNGMAPPCTDSLLRCPECHARLVEDQETLQCTGRHTFAVRGGVPDLVPLDPDDATWSTWQDHLDAFQRRREGRLERPGQISSRLSSRSGLQSGFRSFVDFAGAVVLDVGCGAGRFREQLDVGTRYVGVDPIPLLPDVSGFEFARAVSEKLPFADGSFTDVVVLNALDHMRDVDVSLAEIRRVLRSGGRLHVLQTVLDRGDLLRRAAHELKDFLEDRGDAHRRHETPHHMTEFTTASLRATVVKVLPVVREGFLARSPISPRRMMITAQKGKLGEE